MQLYDPLRYKVSGFKNWNFRKGQLLQRERQRERIFMRFIKLQRGHFRDYFQCRTSPSVNFPINLRGFTHLNKWRKRAWRVYAGLIITIRADKMPIIYTRVCQSEFLFNPRACRALRVNTSKRIIDSQLARAVQGGLEANESLINAHVWELVRAIRPRLIEARLILR